MSQAVVMRAPSPMTEDTPMADPHADTDIHDDTAAREQRRPITRTPRGVSMVWVIIVTALVLLLVILHLTGITGPGLHS
jgi:hypothetical protein